MPIVHSATALRNASSVHDVSGVFSIIGSVGDMGIHPASEVMSELGMFAQILFHHFSVSDLLICGILIWGQV
jgi:hypothetical protein